MSTAIQISGVSKSFGQVKALQDINLEVGNSELFGFIGPDGAGKTTLFRLITSLMKADHGSIRVQGFDPVKDFKEIRKITGYMPGRFSLYQDLSVGENLKFYATIFGTSIEENYHLIRDIYQQIEPFKKRLAGRLSGGMKQKLALSCALIHSPDILVLDEPTTGVDAVSRVEFWDMLQKLKSNGITILVSTPYMDEAMKCDRVALMQNGRVLSIDQPRNIVSEFGKEIISIRAADNYKLLKQLRNYPGTGSAFLFGHEVHFTWRDDGAKDLKKLKKYLEDCCVEGLKMEVIQASIEDCFMELMTEKSEADDE